MKRISLFAVLLLIVSFGLIQADTITLNAPEQMAPPEATQIEWRKVLINVQRKTMTVWYSWRDADGLIEKNGRIIHTWTVRNIPDNLETDVTQCVGPGDPWPCCTGAGTGDCDETDPKFDNIFLFTIRSQDVGTPIGRGLRDLIWAMEMEDDLLSEGNTGTFGD